MKGDMTYVNALVFLEKIYLMTIGWTSHLRESFGDGKIRCMERTRRI